MERIGVKTREFGWDQVLKSLKAACLKDFTFILRALERHCEAVEGPKREGEREMLVVGRGAGSQGRSGGCRGSWSSLQEVKTSPWSEAEAF